MTNSWEIIADVAALLAAAGVAFDKIILPDIVEPVYDRLLAVWLTVDDMRFRDSAQWFAARLNVALKRFLPARFLSMRGIACWTIASWILVTGAGLLDNSILEPSVHPEAKGSFPSSLALFPAYVAPWLFDYIVFSAFLSTLNVVATSQKWWVALRAVIANLVVVTVLYLACVSTAIAGIELAIQLKLTGSALPREDRVYRLDALLSELVGYRHLHEAAREYSEHLSLSDAVACGIDAIGLAVARRHDACEMRYTVKITEGDETQQFNVVLPLRRNYTVAITCATVVVPTAAFLVGVVCLMLCKALLQAYHWICWILLKRTVDPDPKDPKKTLEKFAPGTIMGIVLAIFVTLAKLIAQIFNVPHDK